MTYGIIGALAVALALGAGTGGTKANQQGALALIASAPLGFVGLIAVAIGLLAYSAWKLFLGIRGRGPEGGGGTSARDRIANIGGAIVYLLFFAVAVHILAGSGSGRGSGGGGSSSPRHATAGVLGWPAGRWLVGAAGAAMIAVGVVQIFDALKERFASEAKTERMEPAVKRTFLLVGRVGLVARALVFAVCGYFLVHAAIAFNPRSAVGVDGALQRLHRDALGPLIVGLVGTGLLLFATYSLFEARYRRL
jgi:hypothetical protein